MRAAVLVAVVLLCPTLAQASGGAILIPPAEVDVGFGSALGGAALVGTSTEVLAGIHWASLYWKPTPIDVGVGYVGVRRDVLPGFAAREAMPGTADDNTLKLDGVYVDVAYTIDSAKYWRTWLAARAEWLDVRANDVSYASHGFALRIASELYGNAVGGRFSGGGGAVVAGTVAIGIYVEASHRDLPPELGPDAVTAGVSLRVPFILAGAH